MNLFMTFVINVLGNNLFPGFIVTQFLKAVACLVKEQVLCVMDLPSFASSSVWEWWGGGWALHRHTAEI